METVKLGTLIDGKAGRDAIHIAIAPVVAIEKLHAGQHIGFPNDGDTVNVSGSANKLIGIVDPYLPAFVMPGQSFYMLLYPQTITSLRHEWTHPVFSAVTVEKGAAEIALRQFADVAGISYDELMDAARDYLDHDEYLIEGGRWEGFGIPEDFWDHFQTVTGRAVPERDRGSFFSCSC